MSALAVVVLLITENARGAEIFSGGWALSPEMSSINFQSVKNLTNVESSEFAEIRGSISEDGKAVVRIFSGLY